MFDSSGSSAAITSIAFYLMMAPFVFLAPWRGRGVKQRLFCTLSIEVGLSGERLEKSKDGSEGNLFTC